MVCVNAAGRIDLGAFPPPKSIRPAVYYRSLVSLSGESIKHWVDFIGLRL